MFAVPNNEERPLKSYIVYEEKPPTGMKTGDATFYLAVNIVKSRSGNLGSEKLQSV